MKFQEAYSKFQTLIKKVPMKYVYFVLLLALLSFTVWTRVQPLYLPLADVQAERNVLSFYEQQIQSSIDQQYPNLPQQNKDVLVDRELQSFIQQNTVELEEQYSMLADQIRSNYQDPSGQTYLLGIDPYHYQRQTYYELEYGMAGNTVDANGDVIDTYRLAPLGQNYADTFHSSLSALWHKFLNVFSDVSLNYSFFMVGVLMVTLTVLFAYLFFAKELHPIVGLIAGIVLATSLFFVSRTTGESSDTDIYVLLFPFLTLWLYRLGIGKTALVTAALSGFFMGMYSSAWSAWWFTFVLLSAAIVIDIILRVIQKSTVEFHRAIIFHVSTFLSVGYFSGVSNFFAAYYNPVRSLTTFKSVAVQNLWPNIQTTVAELNSVELSRVVGQLGGQLVVVLSLIGTAYAVYLAYKKKEYVIGLNLLFWWVASLYTTGQGIRFILLMIFPFIIGLGYFLKLVLFDLSRLLDKYFKIPFSIGSATAGLLIFMVLLPGILAGVQVAQQSVPSMDDGWYNSLTYINDNMDENVIITSWWDFGYWFRSVAERPVTFDGGTQVGYNAYWVGRALSTDEYTSTGIIRMLNCGQNTAFETLIPELNDYQVTIDLLEDLVVLPYADAEQELLNQGLPTTVLQYTHCDAPQSVVIASGDMVPKAGVWAHFGAWNYTKAKMYQEVHALDVNTALNVLQSDYGLESSRAVVEYNLMQAGGDQYISPYPQLLTSFTCTGDELIGCNVKFQDLNIRIEYDLVSGEFNYTGNYDVDQIIIDGYTILHSSTSGLSIRIDTATNKGYLGSNEVVDGLFANMYYLQYSECYELAYTGQSNNAGNVMIWLSDYSCLE